MGSVADVAAVSPTGLAFGVVSPASVDGGALRLAFLTGGLEPLPDLRR